MVELASGKLLISYYDMTSGANDLRVVMSQDSVGTAWDAPVIVYDGTADTGLYTSMVFFESNFVTLKYLYLPEYPIHMAAGRDKALVTCCPHRGRAVASAWYCRSRVL